MAESYNFLKDITPVNENMTIKIRIVRLWKPHGYGSRSDDTTIEMVLMDEQVYPINFFSREIRSRQQLKKFMLGENMGFFRFSKHKYRINFLPTTSVAITDDVAQIPRYGFDFVSFGDILSKTLDDDFLIDAIGQVLGIGTLDVFHKNGKETKKLLMEITDAENNTIRCTLWDKYAEYALDYITNHKDEDIVMILQYCKIKEWQGEMSISNSFLATRLMLNEEMEEFVAFRNRLPGSSAIVPTQLSQLSSQTSLSTNDHFVKNQDRKKLDEIRETIVPIKCMTITTIVSVDGEHGWYYLACKKCHEKVKEETSAIKKEELSGSNKFSCTKCEKLYGADNVIPMFKLQIRVIDDSGNASFVLFDRDVAALIRKSACELRLGSIKDGDDMTLPKDFDELLGKKISFQGGSITIQSHTSLRCVHCSTCDR